MKLHIIDIHMYKDYLRFAKLLGLDLKNNRYAFPKNLKESHDELEKLLRFFEEVYNIEFKIEGKQIFFMEQ